MDEATQQNAALVEEVSAAADTMEEQAKGLSVAVSVFKLEVGKGGTRTTAAKPAIKSKVSTAVALHTRKHKLVKAEENTGSDWKEF
jgi:methyl-accepting chemotaxis protein